MSLRQLGTNMGTLSNAYARGISVKDATYGAKVDGTTDDSTAIRAALTAGAAFGAPVYVPEGTAIVSRDGSNAWCLDLPAGTTLYGPGTIKMAASQATSVRTVHVGAARVRITGVTIDGNTTGQGVDEQKAGIIAVTGADDLAVKDVRIQNASGDGILLAGTISRVSIQGVTTRTCARNSVTLYAATGETLSDVLIANSDLECAVQPVDSEPTGTGVVQRVRVIGNRLSTTAASGNYAVAIGGASSTNPTTSWTLQGNTMVGSVWVIHATDVLVSNNLIDATSGTALNGVEALQDSNRVTVSGNTITTAANMHGVRMGLSSGARPYAWKVLNNTITTSGTGNGVQATGAGPVDVIGNTLRHTTGGDLNTAGVYAQATGDMQIVKVQNNTIEGYGSGVRVATFSTFTFRDLVVTGNVIQNDNTGTTVPTNGIILTGTMTQFTGAIIHSNAVSSDYTTAQTLSTAVVRIGGTTAQPIFSCSGTPEGQVTAGIGALALRREGGASTTTYAKESGTGNTGWVAYGAAPTVSTTVARQTADSTAVNNSTVAVALADLQLAVAANSKYALTAYIVYSSSTAADVGLSWSRPAGASMTWTIDASNVTASTANNSIHRGVLVQTSVGQAGSIGVGSKMVATPSGTVTTGGTAGTLQLNFAQVVADATDAVIHADSWIRLDKIS